MSWIRTSYELGCPCGRVDIPRAVIPQWLFGVMSDDDPARVAAFFEGLLQAKFPGCVVIGVFFRFDALLLSLQVVYGGFPRTAPGAELPVIEAGITGDDIQRTLKCLDDSAEKNAALRQ